MTTFNVYDALLRYVNPWQTIIGTSVGFLGVWITLIKNNHNNIRQELFKRNMDSNGLRTALDAELVDTIGKAKKHLHDIIPNDIRHNKGATRIPGRFKVPIYEMLEPSIKSLTEKEILSLISFRNHITGMTDSLTHEFEEGHSSRRNESIPASTDYFMVEVPLRKDLLDKILSGIVKSAEIARQELMGNRQRADPPVSNRPRFK